MLKNTLVRAALLSLVFAPACAKEGAVPDSDETSETPLDAGAITDVTEPDAGPPAATTEIDSGRSDPVEAGPADGGETTPSDAGTQTDVMPPFEAGPADPSLDAGAGLVDSGLDASTDGADASDAADAGDGSSPSVLGPDGVPLICPAGDATDEATQCDDEFSITVTCVSGPCAMSTYVHNFAVTWHGLEFTGTGTVVGDDATPTEAVICGGIAGGVFGFQFVYTTYVPGYTVDGVATVAEDKTALGTGTGFDPRGATQEFVVNVSMLNVGCQ